MTTHARSDRVEASLMLSLGISCWHSAAAATDAKIEYVVRSGRKAQNT